MSCVVMVESSDGGVESSRGELRCVVVVVESKDGGVESSRGELRCNS